MISKSLFTVENKYYMYTELGVESVNMHGIILQWLKHEYRIPVDIIKRWSV